MILRRHTCRVLFFALLLLCLSGCVVSDRPPLAVNGFLDLSAWDFDKDGAVKLDGDWEFYWQRLLYPDEFFSAQPVPMTDHFRIPGRWDGRVIDGVKQTGDGYATFRLKVKLSPERRIMAVRIKEESSAYRLWVNGQEVARNGVVGESRNEMVPQYLLQLKPFLAEKESLEFVLQVSNFHHRKGGVWFPLELGNSDDLVDSQYAVWALDLFLFGSLLIMGLYYLFIFLLRKKELSALYFSLFCLLIAARTIFTNTRFFLHVFPSFPWEIVYKVELLTVTVTFPVMLMFICSLYPEESSRLVVRCTQLVGATASLFVLLVDARLSSQIVVPYQFVILFLYLYITYVLLRASLRKRTGARIILFGMTIFYATIVNDVLASQAIIATPFLASIGMLILVLSQSFGLSKNFVSAFSSVESLSAELEEKNIELTRQDKIKDEFLANTSHELRTPLHGMIGIAESLLSSTRETGSGVTRNSLELIVGSGQRLAHLVNDILDFLRLKHQDFDLDLQPQNLRALTDSVLTLTSPLAKAKPLQLINSIPADLSAVTGDQNRLQQVLYNLIGNAIKYTDRGRVELSAYQQAEEIVVCVADTGIGIAPDQLNAIFQPFVQAGQPAGCHSESSGLGLGICCQLIEKHGGRLSVESTLGEGSRFCFTLPCASAVNVGAESTSQINALAREWQPGPMVTDPLNSPPPQPSAGGMGPRILAVDDDPVNLQVVINHLSAEGMEVTTATNGAEALQRLESGENFDLVLLDIMMPGVDGYEVCRRLRERFSAAELPVLMLTARTQLQDLVQGLECGANDYLAKPFAKGELLARVRAQLKVKQAHKTLAENQRLKQEVQQRRQIEHELRQTQYRLGAILNAAPEAMLALNEDDDVSFCNQAFEKLTGHSASALLGQPLSSLFPGEAEGPLQRCLARLGEDDELQQQSLTLIYANLKQHQHQLLPKRLELEDEQLLMLVVQPAVDPKEPAQISISLSLIESLNHNRNRLRILKETLRGLPPQLASGHPQFMNDLHAVDSALMQLSHSLSPQDGLVDQHLAIVEVMTLTIDYWRENTQTDKAELARESGLWKVYTNEDGWDRTQTLDRYLSLETLPKFPRRKQVMRTAEFALSHCRQDSPHGQRLELALAKLHRFSAGS